MFASKTENKDNFSLTFDYGMDFPKTSTLSKKPPCDEFGGHFGVYNNIDHLKKFFDNLKSYADHSPKDLSIKVFGQVFGKSVNETFTKFEDFATFIENTGLLQETNVPTLR